MKLRLVIGMASVAIMFGVAVLAILTRASDPGAPEPDFTAPRVTRSSSAPTTTIGLRYALHGDTGQLVSMRNRCGDFDERLLQGLAGTVRGSRGPVDFVVFAALDDEVPGRLLAFRSTDAPDESGRVAFSPVLIALSSSGCTVTPVDVALVPAWATEQMAVVGARLNGRVWHWSTMGAS